MKRLIECVPNFSEGRDRQVVRRIEQAIVSVDGVTLLDQSMDVDHNRSVFTFAGAPDPVAAAVLRAASVAVEAIDLRRHQGVHPRLGAIDVVPFVPLRGVTADDCVNLAHQLGERLWQQLRLPCYFYGDAAFSEQRRKLENVRRGGFERLRQALPGDLSRIPDVGGPALHPSAGAAAIGVRKFLIAFNVNLASTDVAIAKKIAAAIRESSGGLPAVKALGLELRSRNLTQVSVNLTDFERTPLHLVFETIKHEAERLGTRVVASEIVGLVPKKALETAAAHCLQIESFRPEMVLENRLADEDP